jgi:hypothetical protein
MTHSRTLQVPNLVRLRAFRGGSLQIRDIFGVIVMVPLFYVDLPGDFSRADALTEREHAVHINSKCY